jgi:hypothetical protein
MGGIFGGSNRRVLRAFFWELEGEDAKNRGSAPCRVGLPCQPFGKNYSKKCILSKT